jgi:hypothetical protein
MAETWTTRMVVPQWGLGTDAPSRVDFDTAFLNLNNRAAFDDGVNYAAVPTIDLVPGRYARVSTADSSYTLYRRSTTAWEYVGGPVSPVKLRSVALGSQAGTDQAFSLEQTLGTPTLWGTYQGDLYASGLLRTGSMIGIAPLGDTLSPSTTGRAYVKTQAAGDLGIVLRAHASTAGNLLTAREQGGSDIVTIDSLGRVQSRLATAFGGAVMPTTSVAAIAPTTNGSDGITTGLLLYGQSSVPTRALLNAYAFNGDSASISTWLTNGMSFGKLPWGSAGASDGSITVAADVLYFRALGANLPGAAQYQNWVNFRLASQSAPSDLSQDIQIFSLSAPGAGLTLPLYLSQENNGSITNLTCYRFNDFTSGRFMELIQTTRVNPTTLTFQTASDWNADGRLRTGVLWKGTSAMRDVRQPIKHVSTKAYAVPGNPANAGQAVAPSTAFTYTFPVMQSRSFGGCDIEINMLMEMLLSLNTFNTADGQVYRMECFVAVNGGSFNEIGTGQENAQQASASSSSRPTGDLFNAVFRLAGIPNNATFQVQIRIDNGAFPETLYIRKLDLDVTECSFEVYTAP